MAQQKFVVKIPNDYSPLEREAISERIIEFVIKRTQESKDFEGNRFPKYSKAYKNSLDFKIAGKTGKVDLTLSGEMLNSIVKLNDRAGSITIGFEDGDPNNGKAEGNIKGTYGSSVPNPAKARRFLGISDNDLDDILSEFPIENERNALELIAISRIAREFTGAST